MGKNSRRVRYCREESKILNYLRIAESHFRMKRGGQSCGVSKLLKKISEKFKIYGHIPINKFTNKVENSMSFLCQTNFRLEHFFPAEGMKGHSSDAENDYFIGNGSSLLTLIKCNKGLLCQF